jgi:hypothetical protein
VQIIIAGDGNFVNLPEAMRTLRMKHGIEYLLCEGGPTLNGYMSRTGLIDEKFLTVSPVEIGLLVPPEQDSPQHKDDSSPVSHPVTYRPTTFDAPGFTKEEAPWWRWISCRRVGDHQFSRYRRVVEKN